MKKLKILLFLCVVACTLTVQAQKQFTLNSCLLYTSTFTYKTFDLDIYMYGQLGVKKFNSTHASNCSAANLASGTLASNPTAVSYTHLTTAKCPHRDRAF